MIANPFQTTALAALQSLIKHALAYDPATLNALGELAGKVIAVQCTFPPLTFTIEPHADGVSLNADAQRPPDTTLKGTALALASLAANSQRTSLYDSGVSISGDQALLQRLNTILRNLDIDWEAALAKLLGDVPAHMIGETIRGAGKWQQAAGARMADAAAQFSVEEARWLPSRPEFEVFTDQVSLARRDLERLTARIAKLQQPKPAPKSV